LFKGEWMLRVLNVPQEIIHFIFIDFIVNWRFKFLLKLQVCNTSFRLVNYSLVNYSDYSNTLGAGFSNSDIANYLYYKIFNRTFRVSVVVDAEKFGRSSESLSNRIFAICHIN
jgi:hypothetical protein